MLENIPGVELAGEVDNEADAVRSVFTLRPDVVILDFALGCGNGLNVLRQVRVLPVRVIILTNDVYPQYRKKCMEAGADYFLDKSRDINALADLLSGLAKGM